MKLIIVLSLESARKDLEQIFKAQAIPVYSEVDVQGFRTTPAGAALGNNWFGSKSMGVYSLMLFAFVPKEQAEGLRTALSKYNQEQASDHPVHAFQLPVEAFI